MLEIQNYILKADCFYQPLGGSTPEEHLEYFARYFMDSVFEELARFTNIYTLQNTGMELCCSVNEIKLFLGILMYMGILKSPRVCMY